MALEMRDGVLVAVGPRLEEFRWAVETAHGPPENNDGVFWVTALFDNQNMADHYRDRCERDDKGGGGASYTFRVRELVSPLDLGWAVATQSK